MKHLKLLLLFTLLSAFAFGQDTPPAGTKQLTTNQGFIAPDSALYDRVGAPGINAFYKKRVERKEMKDSIDKKVKYLDAKKYGAKGDGITDDTEVLQQYLNSKQGVYVFPKGKYLVSGLNLSSNSHLLFDEGAVLSLKDGSNRPVLQNANYSLNIDSNIRITGLRINGNYQNQAHHLTTGPYANEPVAGIRFFGVKNLTIAKANIYHARTYGIWLSRINGLVASDINFEQDTVTYSNQDGLHINGLSSNLYINNISGLTNDDLIALNADDVDQGGNVSLGDITNVIIDGVNFGNSLNGIRLLSANNKLDQVSIKNLVGVIRDNVIAISAYGLGEGNFGTIDISGVDVRTSTPHNVMGEYGGYILINDKAENLRISNVTRTTGADARATIRIQSRADITTLEIDGITTKINQSLTTFYPDISFEASSVVKNAFIRNHQLLNGVYPDGYGIGLAGASVEKLHLNNLYYEQIGFGLHLDNSDVTTLFVNGTTTNYIRYPFYLVNGSTISFALIISNSWRYSFGTPEIYNILDTSTINFLDTGVETFNSVLSRGNLSTKNVILQAASDLVPALSFGDYSGYGWGVYERSTDGNIEISGINGGVKATGLIISRSTGEITVPKLNLRALNTAPSSSTDTGTAGEIRITATYIYVCTATNTWVRSALTTW